MSSNKKVVKEVIKIEKVPLTKNNESSSHKNKSTYVSNAYSVKQTKIEKTVKTSTEKESEKKSSQQNTTSKISQGARQKYTSKKMANLAENVSPPPQKTEAKNIKIIKSTHITSNNQNKNISDPNININNFYEISSGKKIKNEKIMHESTSQSYIHEIKKNIENIPIKQRYSISPTKKFLVETKKVEYFQKPWDYSEGKFVKESKLSTTRSMPNLELKLILKNIWSEENYCSNVESLCCLADDTRITISQKSTLLEEYEEEIKRLKQCLVQKDEEINNLLANMEERQNNVTDIRINKNIQIKKDYNVNELDQGSKEKQIVSLYNWNELNIPSPVNEIFIESIAKSEYSQRIHYNEDMRIEEALNQEDLTDPDAVLEIQEMNALSIISNKPKFKNICQHLQSLMILAKKFYEPFIFQKIEEINITSLVRKKKLYIEELDGLEIINLTRNPKPEKYESKIIKHHRNVIQELDGFEIIKPTKPKNTPQCIDDIEIPREYDMLLVKPVWNSLKVSGSGLNLIAEQRKAVIENQELEEFTIHGKEKPKIVQPIKVNKISKIENFDIKGVEKEEKIKIVEKIVEKVVEKVEPKKEKEIFLIGKVESINLEGIPKEEVKPIIIEKKIEQKIEPKIEKNWNMLIKPIKSTKLLVKNAYNKIEVQENQQIIEKEIIKEVYKEWGDEIKPTNDIVYYIQGIKPEIQPEIKPEIILEMKPEVKIEIKGENKPEIKTEIKTEIERVIQPEIKKVVEFNIDKYSINILGKIKTVELEETNENVLFFKGRELNWSQLTQNSRIIFSFIHNKPKEIKRSDNIIEKIIEVEKPINWNKLNRIEQKSKINIIGKVKKEIIQVEKQFIKIDWKGLLQPQKKEKILILGKKRIKKPIFLVSNGDKFFIQKEPESDDEIIYNDDYNCRNEERKTQIIQKEIIPKMQRPIRAEVIRLKEEESESSSIIDIDVLSGMKGIKKKSANFEEYPQDYQINGELGGYKTKFINSKVIFASKRELGVNLGGTRYQKELNGNSTFLKRSVNASSNKISGIEIKINPNFEREKTEILFQKMTGVNGPIGEGNYKVVSHVEKSAVIKNEMNNEINGQYVFNNSKKSSRRSSNSRSNSKLDNRDKIIFNQKLKGEKRNKSPGVIIHEEKKTEQIIFNCKKSTEVRVDSQTQRENFISDIGSHGTY